MPDSQCSAISIIFSEGTLFLMKTTIQKAARVLALAGTLSVSMLGASASGQTPDVLGCADVATPAASGMDHGAMHEATPAMADHGSMHASTPASSAHDHMEDVQEVDFDLMYIDMMIPHHESIIALAEVAQYELTDPRLIEMAEAIVATQVAENTQLKQLRQEWYGDAKTVSMEQMHAMPGMSGDMAAMEQQMSAEWQVQTFCAAEDKDLAFIEQTIPHHQMAIDTSVPASEHAEHQEIKDIAQDVIEAQQAEINELKTIRDELQATPVA
jgi:uncharacterized protein (DUF305 family)